MTVVGSMSLKYLLNEPPAMEAGFLVFRNLMVSTKPLRIKNTYT